MDLTELGLELRVDFVEGSSEIGKLLASVVGDEELRHPIPVDPPFCRLPHHFHHLLPASAHLFFSRSPDLDFFDLSIAIQGMTKTAEG